MASISISSGIANLTLGQAPTSGPVAARNPIQSAEPGVIFTRGEPWRNQAGVSARPGYSRQDALGQRVNAPASNSAPPPGQPAETGETTPSKPDPAPAQTSQGSVKKPNGEFLSKAEMALLRELQKADQAVKAHEMAHLAAAGGYAKGGASFSYQRGPDGQNYAIGGEVQVDTSQEATPEATIQKMRIVRQAALAPVDPSPQDQRVAAHATLQIAEASQALRLAQSRQSAPATPRPAEEGKATPETAQGIYQAVGQSLGLGIPAEGSAKPKKNYGAYLKPLPQTVQAHHQGLDRIA